MSFLYSNMIKSLYRLKDKKSNKIKCVQKRKYKVMKDCGLKKIYVCINNRYQELDVDKTIELLKKTAQLLEIDVFVVDAKQKQGQQIQTQDFLIVGDTDVDSYNTVDIGIGEKYAGAARYVTYDVEDIDEQYLKLVWARKYGKPLVIAHTKRLLIREMTMDDLDSMYELYDTLKECTYIEPLYGRTEEEEFSSKYIENMYAFFGYGLWLVFLKDTGKLVARIGIENRVIDGETVQELGYLVDAGFQRKHIAWEGCNAVLDYAENVLCLEQIYTCIHKENKKSIALAERLGFQPYAMDINGMNIYRKKLSTSQKCNV